MNTHDIINQEYIIDDQIDDIVDPLDEITLIDLTINQLEMTMDKYFDDIYQLWETEFVPFLNSPDCLVFDHLEEYDFNKFLKFMSTQDTFKLMNLTMSRLKKRRNYLRPYTNEST